MDVLQAHGGRLAVEVGARAGQRGIQGSQQAAAAGVVWHAEGDGAVCCDASQGAGALRGAQDEGEAAGPQGCGEPEGIGGRLGCPALQLRSIGDEPGQDLAGRALLELEDLPVALGARQGRQAVDGVCGHEEAAAPAQGLEVGVCAHRAPSPSRLRACSSAVASVRPESMRASSATRSSPSTRRRQVAGSPPSAGPFSTT